MLMDTDVVLEADKVSKIYSRAGALTRRRLGRTLSRIVSGRSYDSASSLLQPGEFYAVKDATFSLKRGAAFGIIGLNGSGKSTLLRMLAGQLLPDGGQITVTGSTASMIDLTAGFQPSSSGRENIFLRGAALGKSRAEMQALYDDIIKFSELQDAIDAPIMTYSSGMMMRLAFSIVSATAPDILFIDEVLAVGDFRFKQKCLARVRELRKHSAFVMVSHSMVDIARFCDQTMVLDKGVTVFQGPSAEAVEFFETEIEGQRQPVAARSVSKVVGEFFENSQAISDVAAHWCDADGKKIDVIKQGEDLYFSARFKCSTDARNLIVGIPVWSQDAVYVTGFSTDRRISPLKRDPDGYVTIRLKVSELPFNAGAYHSNFVIVDGSEFLWRKPNDVLQVTTGITPYWGLVSLPISWEYTPRTPAVAPAARTNGDATTAS